MVDEQILKSQLFYIHSEFNHLPLFSLSHKIWPEENNETWCSTNLSSVLLSCHCYWKGCGAKGLAEIGLGLVWGRSVPSLAWVECLLYKGWFLFLAPPRHWQERNRKGRAKISKVVDRWSAQEQSYIVLIINCPGSPE